LRLSHRTIYETQVIALHIYCFWAGRSIVIDEPHPEQRRIAIFWKFGCRKNLNSKKPYYE
jgi:hypothetical protein